MSATDSTPRTASLNEQVTAESIPQGQTITLVDKTVIQTADYDVTNPHSGPAESERGTLAKQPSFNRQLTRRFTATKAQRKYARYQEDRFVEQEVPGTPKGRKGARARGATMVKDLWRGKKIKQSREDDAIIEVLYENQRGFFTLGIPHFSSRTLFQFDPKAWTNAQKRGSPVNITNAQVPDPNWEWAWKSWYVDMSRDVDEDGWEYSFSFFGTAWHGSHPWFHSFVRRRRWLRKRVRKHPHHIHGQTAAQKQTSEAHHLNEEYFSIHPSKAKLYDDTQGSSVATSLSDLRNGDIPEDDIAREEDEVRDIATLLLLLRKASIDREKIVLVRNFVHNANDELYYLHEEMSHIMSLLIFQNSRRELLQMLMDQVSTTEENEKEKKRIDYLLSATDAADKEVKKLQYWSDIRGMVREGKAPAAVDGTAWDDEKWAGADASGPLANVESEAKEPGKSKEELTWETQSPEEMTSEGSEASDSRDQEQVAEAVPATPADGGGTSDRPSNRQDSEHKGGERVAWFSDEEEDEQLPKVGHGGGLKMVEQEPVSIDEEDK